MNFAQQHVEMEQFNLFMENNVMVALIVMPLIVNYYVEMG